MTRRTWLYRFFDADDVLLYVGIAFVPSLRWREHRTAEWWPSVARMTAEVFATRAQAADAERQAIATERPLYNRQRPAPRKVLPPHGLSWCASWAHNRDRLEHRGPRLVCRREPGHDGPHRTTGGYEWARR